MMDRKLRQNLSKSILSLYALRCPARLICKWRRSALMVDVSLSSNISIKTSTQNVWRGSS